MEEVPNVKFQIVRVLGGRRPSDHSKQEEEAVTRAVEVRRRPAWSGRGRGRGFQEVG